MKFIKKALVVSMAASMLFGSVDVVKADGTWSELGKDAVRAALNVLVAPDKNGLRYRSEIIPSPDELSEDSDETIAQLQREYLQLLAQRRQLEMQAKKQQDVQPDPVLDVLYKVLNPEVAIARGMCAAANTGTVRTALKECAARELSLYRVVSTAGVAAMAHQSGVASAAVDMGSKFLASMGTGVTTNLGELAKVAAQSNPVYVGATVAAGALLAKVYQHWGSIQSVVSGACQAVANWFCPQQEPEKTAELDAAKLLLAMNEMKMARTRRMLDLI